jgi:hypothetical protein
MTVIVQAPRDKHLNPESQSQNRLAVCKFDRSLRDAHAR